MSIWMVDIDVVVLAVASAQHFNISKLWIAFVQGRVSDSLLVVK